MKKILFFSILLLMASAVYSAPSYARPITRLYKMPAMLINRLQAETKQRQRGDCQQKKRELFSSSFYALNNDTLLILIGLPDYFCNASSFLPVTVDSQGHWNSGTVLESYPALLLSDRKRQFWLASHWEIEAVAPLLHHSLDGLHWQEISLPKQRKIDCCFEWIKQMCVTESQIQVKFTGMDDAPVEYWQTTISDSLKPAPNWQKLSPEQQINDKQCQSKILTSGDWQRNAVSNNEIGFQSATQNFKVVIPRWLKQ